MKKLREVTLIFLIKKSRGQITDICLAMKKRGFGINKWNGVGGKVEENEMIKEAAIREAKEEVGVEIKTLKKIAELSFSFPHNLLFNQRVHVYFSENWENEPIETEEMKPQWFRITEVPFEEMWSDDIFWLPQVIKGNLLKAEFEFGEDERVTKKKVELVKRF